MKRKSPASFLPLSLLLVALLILVGAWSGWARLYRAEPAAEPAARGTIGELSVSDGAMTDGRAGQAKGLGLDDGSRIHASGESHPQWTINDAPAGDGNAAIEAFLDQLALQVLERHGATITDKRVQAGLLELRQSLVSRFGARGLALFEQVIARAFPDRAAEILATVAAMATWEDWLVENRLSLDALTPLERNGLLWQKRRELFGADAEAIWADERLALAARQKAVREVLDTLDQSFDTSIDEKLHQLQTSLSEMQGGLVEGMVLENSVVAQVFFGFESVQQTLRELPSEQRQAEINRIRRQMGYGEEQIERLALRDAVRNARWENGLAYMEARRSLPLVNGVPRDEDLERLRRDYFAHEARTIALEEQDGFFRFERPRVHGRN